MKVLITGFTTRMVNSQRLKNNYLTCEPVLAEALGQHLGHEVDHRAVTPGEDLDKYDLAILGICGIQSRAAAHAAGTAWAFETAKRHLLFCGDWSIEVAGFDFQNALEHWERYMKFSSSSWGYSPADGDRIRTMLTSILQQPQPLLAPFFPWGKHELILQNKNNRTKKRNLPKTQLFPWDPSPFCEMPQLEVNRERVPRWIYASLQDHDDWLATHERGLKWPVVHYEKNNKISEAELLKEYAASWGILAPGYKSAGSGWWRARYNHAAHVGAIMVCDFRDSVVMEAPYWPTAPDVEHMSPDELKTLAQEQRDWFFANIASREQTLSDLENALRAAVPATESIYAEQPELIPA